MKAFALYLSAGVFILGACQSKSNNSQTITKVTQEVVIENPQDPEFPQNISPSEKLNSYSTSFTASLEETESLFQNLQAKETRNCLPVKEGQKRSLKIRFAIGYEDFAPENFVSDLVEANLLQDFLQRPCTSDFPLCNFQLKSKTSFRRVLQKITENEDITFTITTSSISTENDFNLNSEIQTQKSDYAVSHFLNAFRSEDVVIYIGHGRDGGGPDFHPPHATADHHVNYALYQKQKTGRSLLQTGLGLKNSPTKFVGIFGCNTSQMTIPLSQIFNRVNFAGSSSEINIYEVMRGSLSFVASIISNKCSASTVNSVTSREKTERGTYDLRGPAFPVKKTKNKR